MESFRNSDEKVEPGKIVGKALFSGFPCPISYDNFLIFQNMNRNMNTEIIGIGRSIKSVIVEPRSFFLIERASILVGN